MHILYSSKRDEYARILSKTQNPTYLKNVGNVIISIRCSDIELYKDKMHAPCRLLYKFHQGTPGENMPER